MLLLSAQRCNDQTKNYANIVPIQIFFVRLLGIGKSGDRQKRKQILKKRKDYAIPTDIDF